VDKPPLDFDIVAVGDGFGPLDYVLTAEKLDLYRRAVSDPEAAFATIASKDYAVLLRTRYELGRVVNAKHESRYFRPPEIGSQIRTSAAATGSSSWRRPPETAPARCWWRAARP
jgi:hypothetical protein